MQWLKDFIVFVNFLSKNKSFNNELLTCVNRQLTIIVIIKKMHNKPPTGKSTCCQLSMVYLQQEKSYSKLTQLKKQNLSLKRFVAACLKKSMPHLRLGNSFSKGNVLVWVQYFLYGALEQHYWRMRYSNLLQLAFTEGPQESPDEFYSLSIAFSFLTNDQSKRLPFFFIFFCDVFIKKETQRHTKDSASDCCPDIINKKSTNITYRTTPTW